MAENSKIEWTHHTFNPWIGCTKVHAGCAHCYAEEMMDHRYGKAQWGPQGTRVRTSDANWRKPLAWNRAAEKAGERHRVFCASLADVFEDWQGPIMNSKGQRLSHIEGACEIVETMDDLRRDLFALIDQTPHLDWLLLTKRPENVCPNWPFEVHRTGDTISTIVHRPNVWIGTSISDQASADKQIPKLLECRDLCPVLFLSCEPLLGPIDLSRVSFPHGGTENVLECGVSDIANRAGIERLNGIDWVIVGGESGHDARSLETSWVKSIVSQCESSDVACFVKQLGARPVERQGECLRWPVGTGVSFDEMRDTCKVTYRLRDGKGGDWSEWPEDLRVREFPQAAAHV